MLFDSSPLLTLKYELDPENYLDAQVRILSSPKQKKQRWVSAVLLSLGGLIFAAVVYPSNCFLFLALFAFTVLSLTWGHRKKALRKKAAKHIDRLYRGGLGSSNIIGPRILSIHQEGIAVQTNDSFTRVRWGSLSAIFLLPDSVLIFTGPTNFLDVPKAKVSDQEFEALIAQLQKNGPPAITSTKFDFPL